jgi:peptide methionine sulfoxide reductase msrA/msrB
MKLNKLTPQEGAVIVRKGTELPFTGEYDRNFKTGTYACRRCNAPLYLSRDKFDAHCGWPAFDDEIKGAVKRAKDADGMRTEIQCARCGAHLGHVFEGEHHTPKNIRHCVNSISLKFIPAKEGSLSTVVFGGGCFWCTEAIFLRMKGVAKVTSGYSGGTTKNPTYEQVCTGTTGHAEVVKIDYDARQLKLENLLELFFALHDPTSPNKQGNDVGSQYRSAIFYTAPEQKKAVESFIKNAQKQLEKPIVTEVKKLGAFYPAEDYHLKYYEKNPLQPYCMLVITPKLMKLKKKFGLL